MSWGFFTVVYLIYLIAFFQGVWTAKFFSVRVARWLNIVFYPLMPIRVYWVYRALKNKVMLQPLKFKRFFKIYLRMIYFWPLILFFVAYGKGDIFYVPRWKFQNYLAVLLIVLVFLIWVWGIFRIRYQSKRLDSPIMFQLRQHIESMKEPQNQNIREDMSKVTQDNANDNSDRAEYENVKWEVVENHIISPLEIVTDFDSPLAEGMFGVVHKGLLVKNKSKFDVVIKNIKNSENPENFNLMFQEIKTIIHVGDHANIVKFFGVTSDGSLRKANLGIVNEWCCNGSLESFLETHRDCFELNEPTLSKCANIHDKNGSNGTYAVLMGSNCSGVGCSVNVGDLTQFANQICTGMEHLASKKVIHGDLATRNILVTKNLLIKITDFGLSRRLYNYQMYARVDNETLVPWRWMSIEALEDMKFSEKSDIWSFGVTLWEVFTLGEFPYDELDWSADIPQKIRGGLRLQKPRFADGEMYELMQNCWNIDVFNRPTFREMKSKLVDISHKCQHLSLQTHQSISIQS